MIGENLSGASADVQPGASWILLTVYGEVLLNELNLFDVRVFNPHTPSNRHTDPQTVYRKHEQQKKQAYEQRNCEIEHASPGMFSISCQSLLPNVHGFQVRTRSQRGSTTEH